MALPNPRITVTSVTLRFRAWLERWGPILPLLLAEGTVWLGFGALLPILPIYFVEHGVDLPTLGIVVAAWPAARLVGEPVFGWVADRSSRKQMMVTGLVLAAGVAVLPLFIIGPVAFVALRALAGLCASIYDPAARGYLVDANPPERQGETFGYYGAAQMGGFMIGPAVGGVAAAVSGEPTVVFWVAGIALLVSAVLVVVRVRDIAHVSPAPASSAVVPTGGATRGPGLMSTLLIAAVVFNVGSFFAGGSYEVVWSLYLTSLGAGLDVIGLSFATFSLPVVLLSPVTGRLIDREGGFIALVVGMGGIAVCGVLYPLIPEIWFVVVLGLVEGTAFAFASPALYLLVARSSPPGRTSTAQGLFGAAGTVGTIVASLLAGTLAAQDLRFPFYAAGIVTGAALLLGLAIGRRRLWAIMQPSHLVPVPAPTPSLMEAPG
ncbi:MAG: MFS transporter [Chloroflexota bacterium]|nr:MFS transporter [Chloroflexota bacterium]